MKITSANKPRHVTKSDILNDLGLSRGELVELKVKTDLWRDLVACITPLGLTQKELAQRFGVYQPEVSHLLSGKLSKFSVGTLIQYAVTMGLGVQVKITQKKHLPTVAKSIRAKGIGKTASKHLVVAGGGG